MKTNNFDRKFERGENVTGHLDLARAKRPSKPTKRVNIDFPLWMIESPGREAARPGVACQSIIKIRLAERIERSEIGTTTGRTPLRRDRFGFARRQGGGAI